MFQEIIRPCHPTLPSQHNFHISQLPRVVWMYDTCHVRLCHVSPLQWCQVSQSDSSICLSVCLPIQHRCTCHVTVRPYDLYSQLPHQHCMDCIVNIFFACLTIWTECDISLIRCPFEPKRVVLGSWWRDLRTRSIWSDSEHFEFWVKFDPLDHIEL